jgi:hypothetical protein
MPRNIPRRLRRLIFKTKPMELEEDQIIVNGG